MNPTAVAQRNTKLNNLLTTLLGYVSAVTAQYNYTGKVSLAQISRLYTYQQEAEEELRELGERE